MRQDVTSIEIVYPSSAHLGNIQKNPANRMMRLRRAYPNLREPAASY